MSNSDGVKPRISINASPFASEPGMAAASRNPQVPPTAQPAPQPAPQAAGIASEWTQEQTPMFEPEPDVTNFGFINTTQRVERSVPAGLAAVAGGQARGFVQRNALGLTICLAFLLTFALGIMTTIAFMGGPRETADVAQPALGQAVAASLEQDVTRTGQSNLLEVSQEPQVAADDPTAALASAVLLGLTPKRTVGKLTEEEAALALQEAKAILSDNKLRMMREGVLGGVYRIETTEENGHKRIKLHTDNAAVTKDTIADILRRAAAAGQIEIPASLSTAEGDVDMDTMLFNLVQTSLANDGTPEGAEAALEMSRLAFAASGAKTRDVKGARVYVVESGDSLAYISLQFYGKPSDYERIFDANRDVLSSPDKIQIGQRLKIPS